MKYNQNEKIRQVSVGTLVIGVDIASEVHYARAFDWRGIELGKVFRFDNDQNGFACLLTWIQELQKAAGKDAVLVGAEPTGHYWFCLAHHLRQQNMKLVLVNPFHVKRSKELDDNHPSKTDLKDPKTIAKLVIEGRYIEPYIPQGLYGELRVLMECRQRIMDALTVTKNQIHRWLAIYFPEHRKVWNSFEAESSLMVLRRAPLVAHIQALGIEGINQIWREAKLRAVGIKRATSLYAAASRSVGCPGGEAAQMELALLLADYDTKKAQYDEVMAAVERLCEQLPEVAAMMTIKGVGLVTVASFVAEVGDIRRFDSPKQIQKLAGLAIRQISSGKSKGSSGISRRGRARLRTALFRAALSLARTNPEFAALHKYYTTRADNPLKKKQSIVALSCKLIRVFYALASKQTEYDPQRLMGDIHRPQLLAA